MVLVVVGENESFGKNVCLCDTFKHKSCVENICLYSMHSPYSADAFVLTSQYLSALLTMYVDDDDDDAAAVQNNLLADIFALFGI